MRRGEQDWAELVCHGSLVSRTPHCPIGHSGANRLEVADGTYVSTSVEHKVGAAYIGSRKHLPEGGVDDPTVQVMRQAR